MMLLPLPLTKAAAPITHLLAVPVPDALPPALFDGHTERVSWSMGPLAAPDQDLLYQYCAASVLEGKGQPVPLTCWPRLTETHCRLRRTIGCPCSDTPR